MRSLSGQLDRTATETLLLVAILIPGCTPLITLLTKNYGDFHQILRWIYGALTGISLLISALTLVVSLRDIGVHKKMQSVSCPEHTRMFRLALFLAASCAVSSVSIFRPNILEWYLTGVGIFLAGIIYILSNLSDSTWCPAAESACYSCPAKANLRVCARCGSFACPSHRVCINDEHVVACERCNRIDPHTPHKSASKPG